MQKAQTLILAVIDKVLGVDNAPKQADCVPILRPLVLTLTTDY